MGTIFEFSRGDPFGSVRTFRYVQGWRDPEQDRKPLPRVARVLSQDYDVIKKECLAQQALWEDPYFPANETTVFPSSPNNIPFEWKRPGVRVDRIVDLVFLIGPGKQEENWCLQIMDSIPSHFDIKNTISKVAECPS